MKGLQAFKLFDVFGHVTGVRRDENGADARQHVAGDQPGLAEQADVTRVVAGRDEHLPGLLAQGEHLAVGEHAVAWNAPCSVFAAPNGYVKRFTQQRHVCEVVAVAVGEQHGHQRSTVSVNGRGQHFHVFTHANGRVDHDVLAFGVAHKVAVGVVGGRQGGGFDRNHLYAVCEEDGAASGQSLSNVSGSRFHVSARSLQRPLNLHQQGDHGRSDFDFMSFPTGKNRLGFGPHHFGEFGLWFKVDVWNVVGRAQVEVKERIVKLHGAERRRDPMAQRPNVRSVNRKGIFEGEGQPLAFVVNDGVSVFWL